MMPLTKEELIPYEEYERVRESFRRRIIEVKRRRRIAVGDRITLLFENRDTVQFQIQEMIRAERIVDPAKVQDELDVYNAQLPHDGELSATLFIEITGSERIQQDLDALQGIDRGQVVAIKAGTHLVYGVFEGGRSKEDKISAVHFIAFRPPAAFIHALSKGSPCSIVVDHANYRREAPVSEELRLEWQADLQVAGASKGPSA
jgi:hypothetical protein